MLHGAAIMWASEQQQQATITLSTAEAEWYALVEMAKDYLWMRQLLADLGNNLSGPTLPNEDNRSAIKWAQDSASWSKMRHIDTKYNDPRMDPRQLCLCEALCHMYDVGQLTHQGTGIAPPCFARLQGGCILLVDRSTDQTSQT